MVDVFISYPRVSRPAAERIRHGLNALNLDVFFDVEGIDGGAVFPVVIDKALKSAKSVLACWSLQAFERPWVLQECRVAKARGVLVPVAIEPFAGLDVPTEFFGTNYLDLTDWTGAETHEGWTRTLKTVGHLVGRDLVSASLDAVREGQTGADVCISYSDRDRDLARRVARALDGLDLDVWWDKGIVAMDWAPGASRQMEAAGCVVALWTANSVTSEWVRAEARQSFQAGNLVNATVGVQPPLGFDRVAARSLDGWTGPGPHAGWDQLLADIEAVLVRAGRAEIGSLTRKPARPSV